MGIESLFRGMDGDSQIHGSEISAHMTALYILARKTESGHIVECGVGRGWSTLALLLGVSERGGSLISFDSDPATKYAAIDNFKKVGVAATDPALDRWSHVVKLSVEASKDFQDKSVGLLFIDTAHTEEYTRMELNMWLPKMRPDGIICGHDYYWYPSPGVLCGVKAAVDQFAAQQSSRFRLQVLRHDNGLFILWPK
jgi:predicted O-methyltransferase YrrM